MDSQPDAACEPGSPGSLGRGARGPFGPGSLGVLGPLGPEEARKERLAGRYRWMLGALVAQLFLVSTVVDVIRSGAPGWQVLTGVLSLLAYAAWYIVAPAFVMQAPLRIRVGVLAGQFLLSLPLLLLLGPGAASLWIYVAVAGGALLSPAFAMGLGVALAATLLAVNYLGDGDLPWELAAVLVALTAFMVGFAGNIRLTVELRRTREELARAAVAAERERIGRDLHDILGHSLTAIAVKAGLARRMIGRDDQSARTEITDVERLAREALADVRATASGFRDVTLATELAVAGSILRAAGISAGLPQAVDDLDPTARAVFGFVVREATTNVVRHSSARRCTITLTPRTVEILDDGRAADENPAEAEPSGQGLAGLRERVQAVGGILEAGPRPGGGFRVYAVIPAVPAASQSAATPVTGQALPR